MIYALSRFSKVIDNVRLEIAQAIVNNDSQTIEHYVSNNNIIHIIDGSGSTCLYCRNIVRTSIGNGPKDSHYPVKNPWHYEHINGAGAYLPNECIGHIRNKPIPHALGISNPQNHGCYICMGCETDPNGNSTIWHRKMCRTIVNGRTYCHLALINGCI